MSLSFLHERFQDVAAWKGEAQPKVLSLLQYAPPKCDPRAEVVERVDCGAYIREKVYFNTTPDIRVPAYLLLPKGEAKRRPALANVAHFPEQLGTALRPLFQQPLVGRSAVAVRTAEGEPLGRRRSRPRAGAAVCRPTQR